MTRGCLVLAALVLGAPEVWKRIDFGRFSMSMPADLVEMPIRPVDTYVREFRSATLELQLDLGEWSDPLLDPVPVRSEALLIDGRPAFIAEIEPSAASTGYRTGVHFADLGRGVKLTVTLHSDRPIDRALARRVFTSIRFGGTGSVVIVWGTVGALLALVMAVRIRGSRRTLALRQPVVLTPPAPIDLSAVPGIDLDFIARGSQALKDLGYRHLIDTELPMGSPLLRYFYSTHVSADGRTVASLTQQFAKNFANDYFVFATWFASGRRCLTTSSPIGTPALHPDVVTTLVTNERNLARMAQRHAAAVARQVERGEEPVPITTVEDLGRVQAQSRAREMAWLVKSGLSVVEDGVLRPTSAMAWRIFRRGLWPLRGGLGLGAHLLRVGVPAAIAGLLLPFGLTRGGVVAAGAVLGGVYGFTLWQHGLLWSLLVPALLVSGMTGNPVLAGWADQAALMAMLVGFYLSAARQSARGRRAMGK